jgi:hypothetical protein
MNPSQGSFAGNPRVNRSLPGGRRTLQKGLSAEGALLAEGVAEKVAKDASIPLERLDRLNVHDAGPDLFRHSVKLPAP